ncbi:hypothetical protein Ais01nite_14800 [Asanoa ishikariensis]|uniref:Membrane domain of glycerophosphoryl diester phosphodiesterase n=1 Tax=Asanoa ishikariensis TaxID=137265 RepID=A0A1H3UI65_9ACTN|nr:hypothetical protein [Asanoa ishikariensis]GIF63445.1 hypothetical protein Ais01nite_14800 [Asanoa ishikariensis]SDZ62163.1 hypothetical protein SAMN05421684_7393 [Asanoa ishikariensis]
MYPDPSYPQQQPGDPAVPTGGYLPPPQFAPQHADPLISPNYGGWWNRGVAIAKAGWRPLAGLQLVGVVLALLVQAPAAIFIAFASDDLENSFTTASDTGANPDFTPFIVLMSLTVGAALLAMLLATVVTLASVYVGVSIAVGVPPRMDDALRMAVRRLFPLIGWQLLAIPIYLVALCLCVLPIFYVAAVFAVLPVVVAVERTNAIGRCFTLFHRDFGAAAGRIATILGLTIGVALIGAMIGGIVEAATGVSMSNNAGIITGSIVSTLLTSVISGAVAVLLAPLTLTAYADLRARVEPTNAMTIAQQLGVVPPPSPWLPAT